MYDRTYQQACTAAALLLLMGPGAGESAELRSDNPLTPPGTIYWCASRTQDRQFLNRPEPGCHPLVGKEDEEILRKNEAPQPLIKIENLQSKTAQFLGQYREFLICCVSDVESLDRVEGLQATVSHLLKSIQQAGLVNVADGTHIRGWTVSQLIGPVAQARDDLRKLRRRLELLRDAKDRVDESDFEAAGRARLRIQRDEEALRNEFRAKIPPDHPATGTEIQDTSLPNRYGTKIEETTLPSTFGGDIGYQTSPDQPGSPALAPRTGPNIYVGTPTDIPTRQGNSIRETDLSNPTGFEIGTDNGPMGSSTVPSRAGAGIGDSPLNTNTRR